MFDNVSFGSTFEVDGDDLWFYAAGLESVGEALWSMSDNTPEIGASQKTSPLPGLTTLPAQQCYRLIPLILA